VFASQSKTYFGKLTYPHLAFRPFWF